MGKIQIEYLREIRTFLNKADPNTGGYSKKINSKKLKTRNSIE